MTDRHRNTPVVAGVYFLFKAGALTYVGQSKDCYGRIASHRSNGREFDLATVMPIKAELIGQVEAALIRAYQPSGNTVHKAAPVLREMPRATTTPPSKGEAPVADGSGTISRTKARALAVWYGLRGDVIDEAVAAGELHFVPSRKSGRGTVVVALFDTVETYLCRKRQDRLTALGLSPTSARKLPVLPTPEAGR